MTKMVISGTSSLEGPGQHLLSVLLSIPFNYYLFLNKGLSLSKEEEPLNEKHAPEEKSSLLVWRGLSWNQLNFGKPPGISWSFETFDLIESSRDYRDFED